jgi:predicted nucleotidyltransferase
MTQRELSARADVAQSVVSAYENGRREPSVPTLTKLINATGHRVGFTLMAPSAGAQPSRRPEVLGKRRAIMEAATRRGLTNPRLFGSVARGEDRPDSDVDILVDLSQDSSLLDVIGLECDLEELLACEVDVVPTSGLKTAMKQRVLAEAVPL